jgi:ATP phosphoribosyltransferase
MLASSSKPTRRLARVLAEMSTQSASAESFEAALVKLALPSGSLQDATVDLFARANFEIQFKSRDYFPDVNDPELGLISFRAQEVSRYVEAGVADCGITGRDWIVENGNAVRASPANKRQPQPHSALAFPPPQASEPTTC